MWDLGPKQDWEVGFEKADCSTELSPSSLSPHVWWLCYVMLYLKLYPQTIKLSHFDAFGDAQLADMFERFTRIAVCTRPTAPCRSAILSTKTERRNFGDRTKPIGGKPKRKQHLALNISGIVKPPKFDAYLNLFDLICIWFGISFSRFRMAIFYFGVPHCQTPELPFSATSPMTWISEVVPPRPPEKLWGNVEPGVGAELGTTLDVCIKPGTHLKKLGRPPPKKRECNATRSPKIRVLFLRLFLILYVLLCICFIQLSVQLILCFICC